MRLGRCEMVTVTLRVCCRNSSDSSAAVSFNTKLPDEISRNPLSSLMETPRRLRYIVLYRTFSAGAFAGCKGPQEFIGLKKVSKKNRTLNISGNNLFIGGTAVNVKARVIPQSVFLVTFASLFFASSVVAQTTLEEIIVTASKREESMQDAPVAVSVIDGDTLLRAGVIDPNSLAEMVPNVDVNSEPNRDGLVIVMRGVAGTDVRNGADPTTAFHVDGGYVPRLSGANAYFFDVDRVEVLRGPQGTLWGRNSTSGVVNVITKKPQTESVEGDVEVAAGNFEQFIARGALNLPLGDNVAVRASFMHNSHEGYSNNRGSGSVGINEDANDADEIAFRAHLLWDVGENTSLLLTGESYDRDGVGQAGSNLGCLSEAELAPFGLTTVTAAQPGGGVVTCNNTSDPLRHNPLNTQGHRDNSDTNFRFQVDHSFGSMDLYYLAAFRSHERDYLDDNDGTAIIANGIAATGSIVETTQSDTWTHELRLASSGDGAFQWLAGLYYLEEEIDGMFSVFLARDPTRNAGMAPPPVATYGFDEQIVQFIDRGLTSDSSAIFVNGSYDINDSLTLRAGARTTRDEKDKGGNASNPVAGSTFCVFFINHGTNGDPTGRSFNNCGSTNATRTDGGIAQISTPDWTKTTWNVGLDWRINDDLMTYFKVGTGYKAGGWNRGSQGTTPDGTLFVFEPEEILSFEAGAKWDLLDGRGRLNLAAFYYDYTDMQQAAIFTNPVNGTRTNITFNAAESTIYGLEAEGTFLLGETGSISGSMGFLSAEFDKFDGFQDDFTGEELDVSGKDLPRSPPFNATIRWIPATFDALAGSWTPQIQFHYESESFFDISNRSIGPAEAGVRESYTKTNFTLTYEHENGGFYGEAYVFNIEDDEVFNDSSCGSSVGSATSQPNPVYDCFATYQPPRTYGLRLGFRF
jgi:iron complex outermembrane receptor protein